MGRLIETRKLYATLLTLLLPLLLTSILRAGEDYREEERYAEEDVLSGYRGASKCFRVPFNTGGAIGTGTGTVKATIQDYERQETVQHDPVQVKLDAKPLSVVFCFRNTVLIHGDQVHITNGEIRDSSGTLIGTFGPETLQVVRREGGELQTGATDVRWEPRPGGN